MQKPFKNQLFLPYQLERGYRPKQNHQLRVDIGLMLLQKAAPAGCPPRAKLKTFSRTDAPIFLTPLEPYFS